MGPDVTVTNDGTIDVQGTMNVNGSTITSSGTFTVVGALNLVGSFINTGDASVEGVLTVNGGGTLQNACRLTAGGLINNQTTGNSGVVQLGSGRFRNNGSATYSQTTSAFTGGRNFVNDGRVVDSSGQYLFAGSTSTQGTVAGAQRRGTQRVLRREPHRLTDLRRPGRCHHQHRPPTGHRAGPNLVHRRTPHHHDHHDNTVNHDNNGDHVDHDHHDADHDHDPTTTTTDDHDDRADHDHHRATTTTRRRPPRPPPSRPRPPPTDHHDHRPRPPPDDHGAAADHDHHRADHNDRADRTQLIDDLDVPPDAATPDVEPVFQRSRPVDNPQRRATTDRTGRRPSADPGHAGLRPRRCHSGHHRPAR